MKALVTTLKNDEGKIPNHIKFIILMALSIVLLMASCVLFILFGASEVSFSDIINSFFNYDDSNFSQIIIRDIRLPRLIADIIVGVSLALSGAIMQGNTRNPMADSGLMGVSSGAVFSIVIIAAFVPSISRIEYIAYSCLGAGLSTMLIYGISFIGKKGMTAERMVLSGMAISMMFSSLTTAIVLKENLSGQLMRYTAGSSSSTVWQDIYIAGPFFLQGRFCL